MLVVSIGIVVVVFLMYGRDPALEQVKPAELHAPLNRKPHYKLSEPVFPVKSKIVLRFDTESLKGLADESPVTQWPSAGGAGFILKPVDSKKTAIFKSPPLEPAYVRFDGSQSYEITSVAGNSLFKPGAFSIFVVFRSEKFGARERLQELFGWGDCANSRLLVHLTNGVDFVSFNFHLGPPENRIDAADQTPANPSDFAVVVLEQRKSVNSIEFNTHLVGQRVSKASSEFLRKKERFLLGTSACEHDFSGDLAAFIVAQDLSVADKDGLVSYLFKKYDID